MGQHGAPSRLRVDLVALTGLVFLVVVLAVAVGLSIIASSPGSSNNGQLRPDFVGTSDPAPAPTGSAGSTADLRR